MLTTSDPYSGFGSQWGGYTDSETGLVLMGHRYYDPQQGRSLTRDPLGLAGGMNAYRYADDNPIAEDDPSGLDPDPNSDDDGLDWNHLGMMSGRGGYAPDVSAGSQGRQDISEALRQTPVGAVMGAVEAVTGCDYVAGTPVSTLQRGMGAAVAILAVVPFLGALNKGEGNQYSVAFETVLSDFRGLQRRDHNRDANKALLNAIKSDPEAAQHMEEIIPGIKDWLEGPRGGVPQVSPPDWTWHHHLDPGRMQLVPRSQHSSFFGLFHPGGSGGFKNW